MWLGFIEVFMGEEMVWVVLVIVELVWCVKVVVLIDMYKLVVVWVVLEVGVYVLNDIYGL